MKLNYTYNMKKILLFTIVITLFVACAPKSDINGSITDAEGKTIYLEHTGLTTTLVLDSMKLDTKGEFDFSLETSQYPDFYRIRLENQFIVFTLDSTTRSINIMASAKDFNNATIIGSDASKEIQRLRNSNFALQRAAIDGDTTKATAVRGTYSWEIMKDGKEEVIMADSLHPSQIKYNDINTIKLNDTKVNIESNNATISSANIFNIDKTESIKKISWDNNTIMLGNLKAGEYVLEIVASYTQGKVYYGVKLVVE